MKLILTREVANLGGPGDIVEVKDGYARNYLVPRGFGMRWTRGGEKQVGAIRRARDVREIRDLGAADALKLRLEGLSVQIRARAGDGGRLFGAITAQDIVAAIHEAGGPELDRRRVEISAPIKAVGAHQVTVRVHSGLTSQISLQIIPS